MRKSDAVNMFKALCDENRLQILKSLQSGEKCACKLLEEMNISQPTLSHHMRLLCGSGIVDYTKHGKWMHYRISEQGKAMLHAAIDEYLCVDNTNEGLSDSCCERT